MADLFQASRGAQPFSWGANTGLPPPARVRSSYLDAVRAGDAHDLAPLLALVQSLILAGGGQAPRRKGWPI